MDSITHALYKAITAEDTHQRKTEREGAARIGELVTSGLQPIAQRRHVHDAFADATPTDLHIALTRGPELLALQLEFIASGFCPPAGMAECGGDVIISPGRVDLYVPTDKGDATWSAILVKKAPDHRHDRRATWEEQVC